MPNYVYPAIGLIGGTAGFLDAIDGTNLADKDMAVVSVQGDKTYFYVLDVDSAAAEASPGIIAPDANGGDKRWILTGFTPVSAATGFTIAGGTTSKTLTVDETVAMSSKAPKADPTFTGLATAPSIVSVKGQTASIATATPTTIFTLPTRAALFIVTMCLLNTSVEYHTTAFIVWDRTSASITLHKGTLSNISLSGSDVQVTQSSGGDAVVTWGYIRIWIDPEIT